MNTLYRAVVFDADGTLVNTTNLVLNGFLHVLSENNYPNLADEKYIRSHIGGSVAHCYSRMLGLCENSFEVKYLTQRHDEVQDEHLEWISPYPEITDTLLNLKQCGVKVGLFTSGTMYHVERNFRAVGIEHSTVFDAVITADDCLAHKPSPEGLQAVLRCLGEEAAQCIYVGDHAVDVLSGKAAGIGLAVGVSHGLHDEVELRKAGADVIIHRLSELLTII